MLKDEWQLEVDLKGEVEKSDTITDDDIVDKVVAAADAHFQAKLDCVGAEQFTPFMRMVLLQSIDSHWREHLAALDYLRQGIHLRGYAQKNPKQEYKREAFELFSQLLDVVKLEVTRMLMTVRIQSQDQAAQAAAGARAAGRPAGQRHLHAPQRGRQRVAGGRHRPAGARRRCPRSGATTPAPAAAARSTRTATASWPEAALDGRPAQSTFARTTGQPARLVASGFRVLWVFPTFKQRRSPAARQPLPALATTLRQRIVLHSPMRLRCWTGRTRSTPGIRPAVRRGLCGQCHRDGIAHLFDACHLLATQLTHACEHFALLTVDPRQQGRALCGWSWPMLDSAGSLRSSQYSARCAQSLRNVGAGGGLVAPDSVAAAGPVSAAPVSLRRLGWRGH